MENKEVVRRILRDKESFILDHGNVDKNEMEKQAYAETIEQWDIVLQWGKNEARRLELIEECKADLRYWEGSNRSIAEKYIGIIHLEIKTLEQCDSSK